MPVIRIAVDPDDGGIYWCDLSALLRQNDVDTELVVPRANRLDDKESLQLFRRYCASMTQSGHAMLDIVSPDPARQADAVFVCYFVGREDGRALVLLRRLLFILHPDVFAYAADQLAHAIPHPDHSHAPDTMVSREPRATLRESLTGRQRRSGSCSRSLTTRTALAADRLARPSSTSSSREGTISTPFVRRPLRPLAKAIKP